MDKIIAGSGSYAAFTTIINAGSSPVLGLWRRRMDEVDMFVNGIYERAY